jgi:hypothetical protein
MQGGWGLGASQLYSEAVEEPGKQRSVEQVGKQQERGWAAGQGGEVRKGERQMGKQRRQCQGEGCSLQGVDGCGNAQSCRAAA